MDTQLPIVTEQKKVWAEMKGTYPTLPNIPPRGEQAISADADNDYGFLSGSPRLSKWYLSLLYDYGHPSSDVDEYRKLYGITPVGKDTDHSPILLGMLKEARDAVNRNEEYVPFYVSTTRLTEKSLIPDVVQILSVKDAWFSVTTFITKSLKNSICTVVYDLTENRYTLDSIYLGNELLESTEVLRLGNETIELAMNPQFEYPGLRGIFSTVTPPLMLFEKQLMVE